MKKIRILLPVLFFSIILINISAKNIFSHHEPIEFINRDNLLRLHIIANSNSPKDQYLKRIVRDNVIKYFDENLESLRLDLKEEINNINKNIEKILKDEGLEYGVNSELGLFHFPGRTYNNLTLTQGQYNALRIVLGRGEGSNWWCVLLPPLCIENKEKDIRDDKQIEFRSKLLEWIQGRKKDLRLAEKIVLNKEIELAGTRSDNREKEEGMLRLEGYFSNRIKHKLIDDDLINLNIFNLTN